MNTGEKTTVATLAVFFGLIFLLIITTICCVLRRGCQQQSNNREYRRHRNLRKSDFDKSTITSSETRVTDGFASDGLLSKPGAAAVTTKSGQPQTGVLLNITEEDVNTQKEAQCSENDGNSENSSEKLKCASKEQTEPIEAERKEEDHQTEMKIEILSNSPCRHSRFCNLEDKR